MEGLNPDASVHPFGASPLWPPLDETGRPRPLLAAILVVLSAIVVRLFYSKTAKDIGEDIAEKQKDLRIAQMTAIIANQKSHFKLGKEQAQELQETDLGAPKTYESKDDLMVKAEVRVTVDLEEAMEEKMPGADKPSSDCPPPGPAPGKLTLARQSSAQLSGRSIETALKGRKLTAVVRAGVEQPLSTVEDVENMFAGFNDADYPVTLVLRSNPPEALRLFRLVVDEIFDEPVTKQGIVETSAQFVAMKDLLQQRLKAELETAISKTLYARGLEGIGDLPPDELRDVPSFHSGEKLREAIKLAKDTKKHFPELVDASIVKAANDANRRVGSSQRGRMSVLLGLLAPSLPYWCIAVLVHGSLECVVARLCTGQTAIMDLVTTKKITVPEATMLIMQWLAGWWVLRVFGWFTAGLFQARAARMFGIRVRGEAMRAILQQDFEYFDKNPAGELQERLNYDAEKLNRNLLHIPRELCTELIAIFANAFIVYGMAPTDMFLSAMIPLPIIAFGQWYMLKSARSFHRITRRLGEEAATSTAQVLSEIKTVREFVMEDEETRKYTASGMLQAAIDETCQSRAGFAGHGMGGLHQTGEALTLLLGVNKVANGEMSAGDLIAVMMMVSCMIGGKLRGIFERIADLALVIEPAGRICDLLNSTPKIESCSEELRVMVRVHADLAAVLDAMTKEGHTVRTLSLSAEGGDEVPPDRKLIGVVTASGIALRAPGKAGLDQLLNDPAAFPLQLRFTKRLAPTKLNGRFDFEDVEFRYPSDPRKLVLAGVNFTVEQGKQAALTGHAGCGKTTIFKLIQRLYDPSAGRVLLDGRPLANYDVHFLRSKIAIVAQENVLFATSILENIRYGLYPPPSEADVKEALKQASALHFVEAFPDQLLTRVGSRGLALSGGQRQRVAIARAMVRKPNILILDEATSALDPVNEKIVQGALDHLVKTTGASTLTIAHRLTTVMKCDKILVFADGRLKEQGTHEELLKIPVERLPPRGEEKEGQVISGLYNVQWHNMMGTKPDAKQESAEPTSETSSEADSGKDELAKLRTENVALRTQLQMVRKHLRTLMANGKVSTIQEDDQLEALNLHSRIQGDWLASTHGSSASSLVRMTKLADPMDVKGDGPPPTLNLGDRYITSPW